MRIALALITPILALMLLASPVMGAAKPKYVFASGYYVATPCKAIDGDTVHCTRKSGVRKLRLVSIKGFGVDAPETRIQCQRQRGLASKARLQELLNGGKDKVREVTNRRDKYGRSLAAILVRGKDTASILVSEGHARPYEGGKRGSWPGC